MTKVLYVHYFSYHGKKKPLMRLMEKCRRERCVLNTNIVFRYKNVGGVLENANYQFPSNSTNFTSKSTFPNKNIIVFKSSDIGSCVMYWSTWNLKKSFSTKCSRQSVWTCFSAIALQLRFRIGHLVGSSKAGWIEMKCYTSPSGLGWWC